MKKFIFAGVAVLMLAFTGCKGSTAESNDVAAQQDSLAIALGQMFAYQFSQQEQYTPDSLRADRAEFLKGIKVALAADTTKAGRSYLQGLQMGMQMLGSLQNLEKEYGVNRATVLASFKEAISGDSVDVDPAKLQMQLQSLVSTIKESKLANDTEAQANKKATEGVFNNLKKKGAKTLGKDVVYEVIEEGDGAKINASDMTYAIITMTDKNGTVIQSTNGQAQPIPARQYGQALHPALAEGVTAMHVGSEYKFYINLGAETPQGMKPYDYIVFDIKLVPEPAKTEQPAPAPAPAK